MKNLKTIIGLFIFSLAFFPAISFAQNNERMQRNVQDSDLDVRVQIMEDVEVGDAEILYDREESDSIGELNSEEVAPKLLINENSEGLAEGLADRESSMAGAQQGNSVNGKALEVRNAEQRRSAVSNSVREMLMVAERNGGIGEQVRVIAQNQKEEHEEIEAAMAKVKSRGSLRKFFFGADNKSIEVVEEKLVNHTDKVEQLKNLALQASNNDDVLLLQNQIAEMENIGLELKQELEQENSSFSLFGWVKRMFRKNN
jgi:hypothetical protein